MTLTKTVTQTVGTAEQASLTCILFIESEKKQRESIVEALIDRGYAVSLFDRRLIKFRQRTKKTFPLANRNETVIVCDCDVNTFIADDTSLTIFWPNARSLYSLPTLNDRLFQQIINRNANAVISSNRPTNEWMEHFEEAKNYCTYLDPLFQKWFIQAYRQLPDRTNGEDIKKQSSLKLIHERAQALLTKTECEVLEQILLGKNNRKIAEACFLSVATVNNHVHQITKKMAANDRTHTIKRAIEYGWVSYR